MHLWSADRVMNRLHTMLDHAIAGENIETTFDETKMSALETKLAKFLMMNQMGKMQINNEKNRINELISDISHQTKIPIANLLLYSELLAESEIDLGEKNTEVINAIHAQAEKLSFLIQSLVKVSRLESGVIQTVAEDNSVQELITYAVSQIESKAAAKHIEMEVHNTSSRALFDMKWTSEALCNLLDNAVKYTDNNGKIDICVNTYQLFTRIDLKDNGMGIPEEEIPKIFGRFYKGTSIQQEEGVGLGLYLAREIISEQGGYIKVTSKVGEGSLFSVFLRTVS